MAKRLAPPQSARKPRSPLWRGCRVYPTAPPLRSSPKPRPPPEGCTVPKTIAQMKRRLQLALQEADEADAILQLVREAVARYELRPEDVFEQAQLRLAVERLEG